MSHELFGADVAPFLRVWQETWAIDAESKVWPRVDAAVLAWAKRDPARMARCYQSRDTESQDWFKNAPLAKLEPGETRSSPSGLPEAHEWHSKKYSLVYWGAGYLNHTSASTATPPFWNAANLHHAVPMVAFGHAAGLSDLVKP